MPIRLEEDAGGDRAPRIPDGECEVEIMRVFTSKQGGGPIKTKTDGSRLIKAVLRDSDGREVWYDAMVEGPAKWKIACLLKGVGHSSASLAEDGINEYTDFLDERTATRFLVGQHVRIKVKTKTGNDGNDYAEAEILQRPTDESAAKPEKPPTKTKVAVTPRADIPF